MALFTNPFTIAAEKCENREISKRIKIEGRIARKLVCNALEMIGNADVHDGEEWVLKNCDNAGKIMNALFSTDEDRICFRSADGSKQATFYLVYGNDGDDVISDYTDNETARAVMEIVEAYIDGLC